MPAAAPRTLPPDDRQREPYSGRKKVAEGQNEKIGDCDLIPRKAEEGKHRLERPETTHRGHHELAARTSCSSSRPQIRQGSRYSNRAGDQPRGTFAPGTPNKNDDSPDS